MDTKDGGPAFPTKVEADSNGHWIEHTVPGISRRDYFAAAALTGLLADGCARKAPTINDIAEESFRYADCMIEASK